MQMTNSHLIFAYQTHLKLKGISGRCIHQKTYLTLKKTNLIGFQLIKRDPFDVNWTQW